MQTKNIIIAILALAVGAVAGWFAAGLANPSVEAAGRARCPQRADGGGLGQAALPTAQPNATARPAVAKPKRKAPIRSSSDAEVQRRILMGRVATLKKQLAVAKRMDEARKNSPSATESDTAKNFRIREEETNNLKKHTGKAKQGDWTVGEMLKYAPTFFAAQVGRAVDRTCLTMSRVTDALAFLDTVDVSHMTEEERTVHERYAQKLAGCIDGMQKWLDMVDTDDTKWDAIWSGINAVLRDMDEGESRALADAERDALRSMALRELGAAEGAAEDFKEDEKRIGGAIKHLFECPIQVWL